MVRPSLEMASLLTRHDDASSRHASASAAQGPEGLAPLRALLSSRLSDPGGLIAPGPEIGQELTKG